MDFTQIPSKLRYPPKYRAKLSSLHSDLITYYIESCRDERKNRTKIISAINLVSYCVLCGDDFPHGWDISNPLVGVDGYLDSSIMQTAIGDLWIDFSDVRWDIESDSSANTVVNENTVRVTQKPIVQAQPINTPLVQQQTIKQPTPNEDLWLRSRDIPRFDSSISPWLHTIRDGREFTIYRSFPAIPKRQRDITITTDVNSMTNSDISALFPDHLIRTRKPCMYDNLTGFEMHPEFGLILKFKGFQRKQIVDNLVKYPHLYLIKRIVDGERVNFWTYIEIDGKLERTDAVWEELPDTKNLPKTKEFMQEYVVRRYLLERDIRKIDHVSKMDCELHPFLTLFMPETDYIMNGYEAVGREHVMSRIQYLQSMNPMLKSIYGEKSPVCVGICPFSDQCTESECDSACPKYVELMYLLERNNLSLSSNVFRSSDNLIAKAKGVLHIDQNVIVLEAQKTIDSSNLIAYLACCERWKGNCLNCSVYHLSFSDYVDAVQRSWSAKDSSDDLEYQQIWMDYAPTLIISGLDYVQFKDYQAQTLLNILHSRERDGKKTIIVCPKLGNLIGKGQFFDLLKNKLRGAVIAE